jgi:hypothetical protein
MPYGFPSGGELLRTCRSMDRHNLKTKLHAQAADTDHHLKELQFALSRTHDSSIDALLELRPDLEALGKRLIASLLLELEFHSPSRFPKPADDWLTVFFDELVAGTRSLEDFGRNPLTLITYNYDRLLEYRLLGALMAHYGRSESDCLATLRKIPIIHVHGDLGSLPAFSEVDPVRFGPSPNDEAFQRFVDIAAKRIVIVHEAKDETAEFIQARRALQSVDQIVILGFGYGETNLGRLEPRRWRKNINRIFGTVYDLTPSQLLYSVTKPFERAGVQFEPADTTWGAREFLVNMLPIFREL